MKVHRLITRRSTQFFLNREEAEKTVRDYSTQCVGKMYLEEVEVKPTLLKKFELIEHAEQLPSLLGHTVKWQKSANTYVDGIVTRVCVTYPNVGMTIKPLTPCKFGFENETGYEPISFGLREPYPNVVVFVK